MHEGLTSSLLQNGVLDNFQTALLQMLCRDCKESNHHTDIFKYKPQNVRSRKG